MATKILTLCHANRSRSLLLEATIRKAAVEAGKDVEVYSAGVNDPQATRYGWEPPQGQVDFCNRFGVDLANHVSKRVTREDVEGADLVLVSDREAVEMVQGEYGGNGKVHTIKEYIAGKNLPQLEADLDEPWFPRNGETYRGIEQKTDHADYVQLNEMIRFGKAIVGRV